MALNHLPHGCLNLVATLLVLAFLPLILPLLIVYRIIFSILARFFCEDMSGKVVLITGASSGIGEHVAYEYAKKRASLVIVARRKNKLLEVAARARELGSPDVLVACADVSSLDDCKRFIEDATSHFGRYHVVNVAGITSVSRFEDVIDVADFKVLMDVNFWGSVYATFFSMPHLRRTKGKIFVASSSSAALHPPNSSFYTASKAALTAFFEALRLELAPPVTITIGTLGFIDTEMIRAKPLSKDGRIPINNLEPIEPLIKVVPIMSAGAAAKAIVDAICRGERYVTEPSWYRVLHLLKYLCPELEEWCFNIMFLKKMNIIWEASTSHTSAPPSKSEGKANLVKRFAA